MRRIGVRSNMFVLLTVSLSITRLSCAVCLDTDSVCASVLEGSTGEKSSLLQQSALRSAAVATNKPLELLARNQVPVNEGVSEKEAEEADPHIRSALIDRVHNLILGWTPRAACTAAVHMFFASAGMYIPEEQQTFPWIHDYRVALGHMAQPRVSDMNNPQFLKIKIVRNPYNRAVSNWVHQAGTDFSGKARIQKVAAENGISKEVSFLDWLKFVQKVGFEALDAHSEPQFSEWERQGGRYDMILQLESPELDNQLRDINGAYNTNLHFQTMHVTESSLLSSEVSERKAPSSHKLGRPSNTELYSNPEAVELVKEIYGDDFNAYGYSLDLPSFD